VHKCSGVQVRADVRADVGCWCVGVGVQREHAGCKAMAIEM
jgi:hypothetical protein